MRSSSSNAYFATTPTWYAVPQATMQIFVKFLSCSAVSVMSSSTTRPFRMRGAIVSRTAFGCSQISFIMKCS